MSKVQAQTTLPLSGLHIDGVNVRKIGRGPDPAFIASIRANGVQVPLIVRKNGKGHEIIDGGKRFDALQALASKGEIPLDHPVPVIIREATDSEARETSLTTNVIRTAMHPVDEYRAYAQLDLEDHQIADRFGLSTRHVHQRLALGSLDDSVLDAWRDGKISGDTAKAFTLSTDKKQQAQILAKLLKAGLGGLSGYAVKRELKITDGGGRLLGIVGREAYEARGGKATVDLFGEDHVVSDVALLKTMVDEAVAATCQKLVAEGWSWAVPKADVKDSWAYRQVPVKGKATPEEQAQLTALDTASRDENDPRDLAELDAERDRIERAIAARAYTDKYKAKTGCFVTTDDGELRVYYGLAKPEAEKGKPDNGKPEPKKGKGKGGKKDDPTAITNALEQRLRIQYFAGTKAALLAEKPKGALAKVLAACVAGQIDDERAWGVPVDVELHLPKIRDSISSRVMNDQQRKVFDHEDYFKHAPLELNLQAIAEAINPAEARKLKGKSKSEVAKFAIANLPKTGWLPSRLRFATYNGPAQKVAAKPKAKAGKVK